MYKSVQSRPVPNPQATVCLRFKDRRLHKDYAALDRKTGRALSTATKRTECTGETGEATALYARGRRYLVLGLGEEKSFDANVLRKAAASLVQALDRMGATSASVVPNAAVLAKVPARQFGRALGEGVGLGSFSFDEFKSLNNKRTSPESLTVTSSDKAVREALPLGLTLADAANYCRRLAATPPNVATTSYVAAEAEKLAASNPSLKCTVHKGAALEKNELVGLANVGKASENPPCLIALTYTPPGRPVATVALVGKTITYDTGGLSIKSADNMKGMKYDKSGGMAVLGTMRAIAAIKPPCRVVGLLPTAENSISDEAYRADDILRYPNGVSVEVTNTDAEGRLVLADALVYACRKVKPDAIIELSTLTGGMVIALGRVYAGLWCEEEKLRGRIEAAAAESGERVWRMPLHADYREMMKAKHADIWNSAPVREAHPVQGAAFLSYFVDEGVPWAHIDIAGVATRDKDNGPFPSGPTGFGVRLLADLLAAWR